MDDAVKAKEHVPPKFYEVGLNLLGSGKSKMAKEKRKMLADTIEDF